MLTWPSFLASKVAMLQWYGHPCVLVIRIPKNRVIWASPVTLTLTQKCNAFDKSLVCSRRHGCHNRWELDSFSCEYCLKEEYCVKIFYCFELLAAMSLHCETGMGIHQIAFSLILFENSLIKWKKKPSENNNLKQNFRPNIQIKLKTNKSFRPQLKSAPTRLLQTQFYLNFMFKICS